MWITAVIEKLLVPTLVTNNPKQKLIKLMLIENNNLLQTGHPLIIVFFPFIVSARRVKKNT